MSSRCSCPTAEKHRFNSSHLPACGSAIGSTSGILANHEPGPKVPSTHSAPKFNSSPAALLLFKKIFVVSRSKHSEIELHKRGLFDTTSRNLRLTRLSFRCGHCRHLSLYKAATNSKMCARMLSGRTSIPLLSSRGRRVFFSASVVVWRDFWRARRTSPAFLRHCRDA